MRQLRLLGGIVVGAAGVAILSIAFLRAVDARDELAVEEFFSERAPFAPDSVVMLGRLGASLRESSGAAVSSTFEGVVWSHNDSGDGAVIYAVRPDGGVARRFRIDGVRAIDWEGMDIGPCPDGITAQEPSQHCLYLGDVGDNEQRRATVEIHVLPEPDPSDDHGNRLAARTHRFRYGDQPHDVEALAVAPTGRITLITKGRRPALVAYHIDPPTLAAAADSTVTLMPGDTLPMRADWTLGRTVTGASYSPSGRRLVARTYTELFFFAVDSTGALELDGEPCFLGALEPQGEAVSFVDEISVITTSEATRGRLGSLLRIRCS